MVEPIRTGFIKDKGIQVGLTREEMISALRHGNIGEIKAQLEGVSLKDFETFMGEQSRRWRGEILKDYVIKEGDGTVPEPSMAVESFPIHSTGVTLSTDDRDEILSGLTNYFRGKAFKAGELVPPEGETPEPTGPISREQVEAMGEETLAEWEDFMGDVWSRILDNQMLQDYEKRMAEVKLEVQRAIQIARAHGDVETVLLALAKVNQTRNGCLMTWLGKKAFMTNQQMNQVANDLKLDTADTRTLFDVQSKTRDGQYQMQMITMELQKVVENVSSTLTQVHSMIGEIKRTKREIVQKYALQS